MNIKKIRRVELEGTQGIRVAVASPNNELFVDLHSCAKVFDIKDNEDTWLKLGQLHAIFVPGQQEAEDLLIEQIDGNPYISLYTFIDILIGQNRELVIQTLVKAITEVVLDKNEVHYHG